MKIYRCVCLELQGIHVIPPHITKHKIELDTMILPAHQRLYCMNFNYVMVIKQNIDKFLVARFIELMEQATWLSLIVVVLKKMAN